MPATSISRIATQVAERLTFTDDLSTTGKFSMATKSGGMIQCVSTSSNAAVTVNFYSIPEPAETDAYLLCDATNTAVTVIIAPGRCYQLPDQLFASAMVKVLVTESATAVCRISVKT